MIYIGVDPGASGAIAIIGSDFTSVFDTPDIHTIASALKSLRQVNSDIRGAIEKVGAMPKQGVSSTFSFGSMYGAVQGVFSALSIPYVLVPPREWQKGIIPPSLEPKERKEKSIEIALSRYPDTEKWLKLKKHHGRADALHIANYARLYWRENE